MEKQIAYIRYRMIGLIAAIVVLSAWQWDFIVEGVMSHVYTTGSILSAFGFAIVMAFIFVFKLKNEVIAFNALKEMWDDIRIGPDEEKRDLLWRHYRCSRPGRVFKRPRLLGHAYDLVTDELARTRKFRISVETMNTLVHKIGQTIDDEKSLLGYMSGLLVFMGLIGTFIGLLHMVGSMGGIIGTLANSAGGAGSTDAFQQLLGALQEPLKGMASGFAASLFGLFSSLVVGLLGRMAGQAAGVLKNEFEAWLAGVAQIGGDEESVGESKVPSSHRKSVLPLDEALIQTIGGILSDYSKVAGSFDIAARLLHDVQAGQGKQTDLIGRIAEGLSRVEAVQTKVNDELVAGKPLAAAVHSLAMGLEALTASISGTVTTELEATRTMLQEMERSHSANLRVLASNHAQTAVQIAAVLERSAPIAEPPPHQLFANIEAKIDGAVKAAMQPIGAAVSERVQQLETAIVQFANEHDQSVGNPSRERDATQRLNDRYASEKHLQNSISEGFDRLNQNISMAFSAYSSLLKVAVAALEKSDTTKSRVPESDAGMASRNTGQVANL
jgi:hypothetical protein